MIRQQAPGKIFVLVITLLSVLLYFIPTGFPVQEDGYVRSKARVVAVDNQQVYQRGVVKTGIQGVSIEILDGVYQGAKIETTNTLLGKLEMDKLFEEGDVALVVLQGDKRKIYAANVIDYYRLDVEGALFFLFALARLNQRRDRRAEGAGIRRVRICCRNL